MPADDTDPITDYERPPASPADHLEPEEGEADDEPAIDAASAIENESADDEPAIDTAIQDDLQSLLAERDSFRDIALRLQADFENYKKRVAAQHAGEVDRATGRLAEALLPVLDAAEAAFVAHPSEVEPLYNLLLGELRKQGLEAMNLHERPFDPAVAEAVIHEPADDAHPDEPVVSEVLRTGYTWKGRVLRAAMVKVRG